MADVILWANDNGSVAMMGLADGVDAVEVANSPVVPNDRPHFVVDAASLPDAPVDAWRIDDKGVVSVDPSYAAPVPTVEEKLARAGLTVAELRAALGLAP